MAQVSASDVARAAGVSGQTVSRVLNGSSHVDPETRDRVVRAMSRLGYRPNRSARALRTGRTGTVGVVVRTLASVGNARLLEAVASAAAARGLAVLVVSLPAAADGAAAADTAFEALRTHGVDGAIVVNEATPAIHDADDPGFPIVAIDAARTDRFAAISADHAGGAEGAVRHLLRLGHATVHHLAGPSDSFAAQERERGWRRALAEAGARAAEPLHGDWTASSGYELGTRLIADAAVTGVFAANDQMALGLLHAADRAGRMDLAVVGFDDVVDAAHFQPPLTTVAQPFDELGSTAVTLLESLVAGVATPEPRTIPTRLIVRESSRRR